MNRILPIAWLCSAFWLSSACAGSDAIQVQPRIPLAARPFPLSQVQLLDGPFKHARELDRQYLLSLDPDRLLHNFRVAAGLPSSAKPLGGWEEPKSEVRGHFVGHYLSACALIVQATGDARLKAKADYVVAEMAKCQEKMGNGYLSAFPESFIDRVEACQPVWAPWYTLHKIYAGLVDMYIRCGNRQALDVAKRAADWVKARCDKLSDAQMQKMLDNEHGGMNDVLAELYAVTGEDKYLRLSERFNHHAVLDPLARREDKLTGLHANTQFPKIIGSGRQYELTGNEKCRTVATFFWDAVTRQRSYVTGGNSDDEHFSPKEELSKHLGQATTETCNTYNMLKLTRLLFGWDPRPEYADYYERALYNHILASQNPEDGMVLYYLPLKTGVPKVFGMPNDSFWCCTGTGVENHARYGESIYFHGPGNTLFVNLFIPSELSWPEQGLTLRQETKYPESDSTRLTLTCKNPAHLTLKIRHPYWATSGIELAVNGRKESPASAPGSYITLARLWHSGDTIKLQMPMRLRTEGFRDNPRKLAILYGPLVLCAQVPAAKPLPAIVADPAQIACSLVPVAGKPLHFVGSPAVFRTADEKPLTFMPLFAEYKKPYIVYWDVLDAAQWDARIRERRAELQRHQALESRTVDRVLIGDEASENSHRLKGEQTGAGEFSGRHWRHAGNGWFSYEMKVPGDKAVQLLCAYWGSDVGREFDILVEGRKIAAQKLDRNRPDEFFDVAYPIPADLTHGKRQVTVRFQAHPQSIAGGVFDCRILTAP
ncbi:MAG: beta-L-arabinofuranosidase domain-containing protein [Thermoguttaceae bacterium]